MGRGKRFTEKVKWCNACKEWHLTTDFGNNKRNLSGLQDYCKWCQSLKSGVERDDPHPTKIEGFDFQQLCRQKVSRSKTVEPGHIYVIGNAKLRKYKVGVTKDVQKRLGNLLVACPVPLELVDSKSVDDMYNTERMLHEALEQFHSHGEWFNLSQEQATKILTELVR